MTRILLVEDDLQLTELLKSDFELEGFAVTIARDGIDGLEKAKTLKPDLLILDVMLPKMSGYDVCRTLRREKFTGPILMLTAKGQETDKVIGFQLGADDYLTKPFGGLELMARVKALLRRTSRAAVRPDKVRFDRIEINFRSMEATRAGKPIHLTPKEFRILELLVANEGAVVSRKQFLEEIWGYEDLPTTRTLDNQVLTLRQKLAGAKGDSHIVTVHSVGYKFVR